LASTLNVDAGADVANTVTVPLGGDGSVCVYTHAASDVIVDVTAWWGAGGLRARLDTPRRPVDTRAGARPQADRTVGASLSSAVPPGTRAVVANLTAVGPTGPGFVSAWACGTRPNASALNYDKAIDRAGHAIVGIDANGTLCMSTYAAAHLLVDVTVTF